jgi:hypothetical protein
MKDEGVTESQVYTHESLGGEQVDDVARSKFIYISHLFSNSRLYSRPEIWTIDGATEANKFHFQYTKRALLNRARPNSLSRVALDSSSDK